MSQLLSLRSRAQALQQEKPSQQGGHAPQLASSPHDLFFKFMSTTGYFPSGSKGKASAHSAGDSGSIPGSGRALGEGNGDPLQYSCLENAID